MESETYVMTAELPLLVAFGISEEDPFRLQHETTDPDNQFWGHADFIDPLCNLDYVSFNDQDSVEPSLQSEEYVYSFPEPVDVLGAAVTSEPMIVGETILSNSVSESLSDEAVPDQQKSAPLKVKRKKGIAKERRAGSGAPPAQFCHICWRSSSQSPLYVCSEFNKPSHRCRKVECERCVLNYCAGDASEEEKNELLLSAKNSTRKCLHCCGKCPGRAQCKVYEKTNARRRQQQAMASALAA
eukprot:CAMPEP_0182443358 /NCGR_PEP_ID=MMETSP1172-20130603/2113_1 /TAXON_ID=708627 /ORGANISM="Timspurckia oligopyrenoides, Strain CCMP3278" /LENGTH=241 /DNA_ID=CAMNT_0024638617 /DNA_START=287 /DNA_END=1012 /DNA_ORIENTATION=-